ncbi:MAG: hypothetical protein ACRCWF_04150 [Beijerinckiaceae bacterium]
MPRIDHLPTVELEANVPEEHRNPMFELLVQSENDVTGLMAYALYKQNKRDWLVTFQATNGRAPTDAEVAAFILGERIPRRTSTYRNLAEDMLAKGGPKSGLLNGLMSAPANDTDRTRTMPGAPAKPKTLSWRYIGFLLAMLVVMAIVFRVAAGWLFR